MVEKEKKRKQNVGKRKQKNVEKQERKEERNGNLIIKSYCESCFSLFYIGIVFLLIYLNNFKIK